MPCSKKGEESNANASKHLESDQVSIWADESYRSMKPVSTACELHLEVVKFRQFHAIWRSRIEVESTGPSCGVVARDLMDTISSSSTGRRGSVPVRDRN